MRKVVIHKPGGYKQLKIEEHPDLNPSDSEVLIEVRAIGVNYADCSVRWGIYESAKKYVGWPITPGFEMAGIVKSVGRKITRFRPGDQVFGITRFGGYATQVVLPEHQVFGVPKTFTLEQAAGFAAVYMTAYHAIHQLVRIRAGGTVLVHSAAGGVGTALLQLLKISGFHSIAVVGSSHKVETAKFFGAEVVIDKSHQPLWSEVEKIAPDGLDAIFDANGAETLRESYDHLAVTGKLIAYGAHTMLPRKGGRLNLFKLAWTYFKTPRFNPLSMLSENRSVAAFNVSFFFDRRDIVSEGMNDLLRWVDENKIIAPKTTLFQFDDVAKAHAAIESGQTVGKLILIA